MQSFAASKPLVNVIFYLETSAGVVFLVNSGLSGDSWNFTFNKGCFSYVLAKLISMSWKFMLNVPYGKESLIYDLHKN